MHHKGLMLALGAVVLLCSCGKDSSVGVRIDSKLRSYVPADCTLLAGADVDSLTAAPFFKRHSGLLNIPALNKLAEETGVDPRRDLSSVLVAWQDGVPLIFAEGRFNGSEVGSHLESLGSKRSEYRSQSIFEANGNSAWLPEKNVFIGGPSGALRALIDNKGRGIPQPLLHRLRLLPGSDQVWIVSSRGLPLRETPLRSDVRSAVSNIAAYVSGFSGGVMLDAGGHVYVELACDSADDAKQVHAALRGGIGLARLTTKDNELAVLKLYDAIQVTYQQQTVSVRADLSSELADKLLALTSDMHH